MSRLTRAIEQWVCRVTSLLLAAADAAGRSRCGRCDE